ncbi:MAG: hypothetical protein AAF467_16030 [Actinomycetota bacterium]
MTSQDPTPIRSELVEGAQRLVAPPARNADAALVLGLLRGVSVFRGAALVWALVSAGSSTDVMRRPGLAVALLAMMIAWTALVTIWPRRGAVLPVRSGWVIVAELAVGAVLLVGDGFVYDAGRSVALPWSWPTAGVLAAGVVFGVRMGLAAAIAMVAASLTSEVNLGTDLASPIPAFSRAGLWIVTGVLAGYVAGRLRQAEAEVTMARAREEVARQLHDGVLQTLAVIQRRSADGELAAMARDQEHDLRRFLAGATTRARSLEPELRRLAQRHEGRFGTPVSVVVAADAPRVGADALDAALGAVGEALANAGKHANASRVALYAEPADPDDWADLVADVAHGATVPAEAPTLFVSVKDDGDGFDPAAVEERIGLSSSIRGRIMEVGGWAEVASRPGRGTEVKLWL